MKKLIVAGFLLLLTACATVNPLEEAGIEHSVIYKFVNPNLSTTLYVKLLPPTSEGAELLFKTARNDDIVRSLEFGQSGVNHQKGYLATERGKVSFHFIEEGLFEELMRSHQYSRYGSQQENVSVFRYRLDFRRAIKMQ